MKKIFMVFVLLSLICPLVMGNQTQKAKIGFEITGFADVLYMLKNDGTGEMNLNQLELGIKAMLGKGAIFEAAIAYDSGSGNFGIGMATFMLPLMIKNELKLSMIMGQFDIPFGLSSSFYAATDNKLISVPLVNEQTINGWNNAGAILALEFSIFELNLYGVSGQMDQITSPGKEMATGMRIKAGINKYLSIGFSYAYNNRPLDSVLQFFGVDAKIVFSIFELELETIRKADNRLLHAFDTSSLIQLSGSLKDFIQMPLSFVLRYGNYKPYQGLDLDRITFGLTYSLTENLTIKLAYEISEEEMSTVNNNIWQFQILGAF